MKKIFLLSPLIAITLGMGSCDVNDLPIPDANLPSSAAPTPPTPIIKNAFGVMVSIKMDYEQTNSMMPMPIKLKSQIAVAAFPVDLGSTQFKNVGTLSVNNYNLDKADNHSYTKMATDGLTPSSFDFEGGSKWKNNQLGIDYSHNSPFPEFTGSIPNSISKSEGFDLNLAGSIKGNPDSIYVLIVADNEWIQKSLPGNATSVTFTKNDLQKLPKISNNTAILEVVPFSITMEKIGGKDYAFIKEHAACKAINIE